MPAFAHDLVHVWSVQTLITLPGVADREHFR